MLSYQHSYHAGNHADVLKHLCLLALIEKLQIKAKPYFYLDTHAGNGCYTLTHANAHNSQHVDEVVAAKLSAKMAGGNAVIQQYQHIVSSYLDKGMYPGSPLIAEAQAREQDTLHMSELHPQAFEDLSHWAKGTCLHIHKRDGFETLIALTPPKPNRGMVLIDPAYEQAQEYKQVEESVKSLIQKWPQGIIAIWYPLLSPTRINRNTKEIEDNPKASLSEKMLSNLSEFAEQGMIDIQFAVQKPSELVGMYGSGMVVINPPWQFEESMKPILSALTSQIQIDDNSLSHVQIVVPSP